MTLLLVVIFNVCRKNIADKGRKTTESPLPDAGHPGKCQKNRSIRRIFIFSATMDYV